MSKTTLIRFDQNYYAAGEIKYAAGKHYPITEETDRQVTVGIASYIEVDLDVEKAEKLAMKAQQAADRAVALAAEAQLAAEAAADAKRLSEEAAAAIAAPVIAPAEGQAGEVAPALQTSATSDSADHAAVEQAATA